MYFHASTLVVVLETVNGIIEKFCGNVTLHCLQVFCVQAHDQKIRDQTELLIRKSEPS